MMLADLSNLNGPISSDDIISLKQAGVGGLIIGLQYPSNGTGCAHQQIECALESNMPIVAYYQESQFIGDIWHHVEQYKMYIPQIFVACEENSNANGPTDRVFIDNSLNFIDALGMLRGGIYTRKGWWEAQSLDGNGSYHWYGDRDLWAAQYDNIPDVNQVVALGDWTKAKIKQYAGGMTIGRLQIDLDVNRDW